MSAFGVRLDEIPSVTAVVHDIEDDAPLEHSSVAVVQELATYTRGKRLSDKRVLARMKASKIIGLAASTTCGISAVATALSIHVSAAKNFANPADSAAMTLGDVLACPKPFAIAVLSAALTQLQSNESRTKMPCHRHHLFMSVRMGEIAQHLESGKDDGETLRRIRKLKSYVENWERDLLSRIG